MFSKSRKSYVVFLKLIKKQEQSLPPKKLLNVLKINQIEIAHNNVFEIEPEILQSNDLLVYFHGGAFISGISSLHWQFIQKLSSTTGCKIILLDYPYVPKSTFEETLNFALETYKHYLKNNESNKIYFAGDSAGGGLCVSLSLLLKEKKLPQAHQLILLSPWLDVSMTNSEIENLQKLDVMLTSEHLKHAGELYAGNTDNMNPLISPIYGDLKELPEINLFIGTHDILLADAQEFSQKAKEASVSINYYEYPEMFHTWMHFPLQEAEDVFVKIKSVIENN